MRAARRRPRTRRAGPSHAGAIAIARSGPRGSPSTASPAIARTPATIRRAASIVGLRQPAVAVDAEVVHDRPRRRHRQARPRALHARATRRSRRASRRTRTSGSARSSFVRCRITDAPFGAYPSLWRSAEIVVTPSTRKSHGGTSSPFSSMNGSTKPPMHASTCIDAPTDAASARELRDRVDHALRVLRRGADDEHGVVVDARGHRVDVGAPVGVARHLVHAHAEVVRGLVERRVRARRR